jgi:surfeit locus 1 family protein
MSMSRRFRLGLAPSLAAALGVAITVAAGMWQMSRAEEKERRQEKLDAMRREPAVILPADAVAEEDLLYHPIRVAGSFVPQHTVFLDNRLRRGIPGFEIVTPMRIGSTERFVAVNRGWIAGTSRRDTLPQVKTPPGFLAVEGIVVPAKRVYQLERSGSEGKVWLAFSVDRMREQSGLDLQPILVQQESALDDGLERDWDRPDAGRDKHLAYAFQWFSMALAILVVYVVLGFRRPATNV